MKRNITGKKAATAASACTPSIWPMKTLLMVPDSDCRMLASTMGPRNTRKVRHNGWLPAMGGPAGLDAAGAAAWGRGSVGFVMLCLVMRRGKQ